MSSLASTAAFTYRHLTSTGTVEWKAIFFDIQRQVEQDWVFEAGYYGTRANHLVNRIDGSYSLPKPGNIDRNRRFTSAIWPPDPTLAVGPLSSFSTHLRNGSSVFHSMQAKVEKRFSSGFTLLGSFIWAKTIGDVPGFAGSVNASNSNPQNPLDRRADRSLDAQHMGRRFVTNYIYELPFGQGKQWGSSWKGVANAIAGGWALSGILTLHDGQPAGLSVNGNPPNATTVSRSDRPNVVGEWQLSQDERTLDRYFNTDAFVKNNQYEFGNAGRNILNSHSVLNCAQSAASAKEVEASTIAGSRRRPVCCRVQVAQQASHAAESFQSLVFCNEFHDAPALCGHAHHLFFHVQPANWPCSTAKTCDGHTPRECKLATLSAGPSRLRVVLFGHHQSFGTPLPKRSPSGKRARYCGTPS